MPRHRASSRRARSLPALVLTGAALGGPVVFPVNAVAAPLLGEAPQVMDAHDPDFDDSTDSTDDFDDESDYQSDDADDGPDDDWVDHESRPVIRHREATHRVRSRPMTSGERQYRNGCRQGYITDGCQRFDVTHLLGQGINPYL